VFGLVVPLEIVGAAGAAAVVLGGESAFGVFDDVVDVAVFGGDVAA
jgi:hypothetical protein